MLDHVSIGVRDLGRATDFYDAVLKTLGLHRLKERPGAVGYGPDGNAAPTFWVLQQDAASAVPGPGLHLAFHAQSRVEVDSSHATALSKAGRDAGRPGPRPQYTAGFYGAFVLDLDGYKIEAVFREALHTR